MNPSVRVDFDGEGFRIEGAKIAWSDLSEVVAFKEDLWSFDAVRLGFRTRSAESLVSVGEEAEGYRPLLAELSRRLPGFRNDWFPEVAFPAFDRCETLLWRRLPE